MAAKNPLLVICSLFYPLIIQCPWGYKIAGLKKNFSHLAYFFPKVRKCLPELSFSPYKTKSRSGTIGEKYTYITPCQPTFNLPNFQNSQCGIFVMISIMALTVLTERRMHLEVSNVEFSCVIVWTHVLKYL